MNQNTYFSNCNYCYSQEDQYSLGCNHCDNGERQLNYESMSLAISAKEWADERIDEFWSEYNKIFSLRMGVTKWSIYSDKLHIEAGFSCRGSYTGKDFEFPVAWLYLKNRKEFFQSLFDNKEAETKKSVLLSQHQRLLQLKEETRRLEQSLGEKK